MLARRSEPAPARGVLKLARKIEDALIGQSDLLDADDGEVADIVRRAGARRARHRDHDVIDDRQPARSPGSGGGLIKVDPTQVATERPGKPARSTSVTGSGVVWGSTISCVLASCRQRCANSPA